MLKYKLANRNKVNYLLTPVFKAEASEHSKSKDAEDIIQQLVSEGNEGDKYKHDDRINVLQLDLQQHMKPRNKLINLPLLRNKTEVKKIFKNKPKSLLMDIEQSLLLINKKISQERSFE